MKNKLILTGILSLTLVFGFGLVLTLASCELEPKTAEITVTNSSSFPNDNPVTVRVYATGRNDPLASQDCTQGSSVTFSLDEGDYSVRVTGGGGSFYYPQDGSTIKMSGDVKLNYTGNAVTRSN